MIFLFFFFKKRSSPNRADSKPVSEQANQSYVLSPFFVLLSKEMNQKKKRERKRGLVDHLTSTLVQVHRRPWTWPILKTWAQFSSFLKYFARKPLWAETSFPQHLPWADDSSPCISSCRFRAPRTTSPPPPPLPSSSPSSSFKARIGLPTNPQRA